MDVEIYGVEAGDFRCSGCIYAKSVFDCVGIKYTFHKVLTRGKNQMPEYNMELINQLVKKAKLPYKPTTYPIIFIDDKIVSVRNLRDYLKELGYNFDELD